MKKIVTVLFSALLSVCCAVGFAGCGPIGNNINAHEYTLDMNLAQDHTATVSMLIPSGEIETGLMDKLIDGFKLKYPNITVKYDTTNLNSMDSTVRNNYMAETLQDIVWTNSPDFAFLVGNDLVYSIDAYMAQAEEAMIYDFDEDFYMQAFDFGMIDGKHYAFPRSVDSVVTHVNTDLVQKAGAADLVKDGWTWEDFIAACKLIRAYMNKDSALSKNYVIDAYLSWSPVAYSVLRSFGAEVIDEDGKVAIDSDATRAALTMIREDLVGNKIIPAYGVSGAVGFEGGGSAFMFHSTSAENMASKAALKGKYDLVSFPLIGDSPKIGAGLAGYAVTKSCKDKDACFAFMTYMLSEEGQNLMAEGGLTLAPVRKDLAAKKDAKWRADYSDINMDAYLYGMEYKVGQDFITRSNPKCKYDLDAAVNDMIGRATDSKDTIDDVVARAKRDLDKALLV